SGSLAAAEAFRVVAERLERLPAKDVAARNDGLKHITRIVNPVLFTVNGPYEMDPALQLPSLPGLAPVRDLAQLDPQSERYRFLRTKLVRQRNRVEDALRQATAVAVRLERYGA